MNRLLALARSRWVRGAFVVVAVGAAVAAVVSERDEIGRALATLPPLAVVGAAVLGALYLLCTLASWRVVLADLGSPLRPGDAVAVFGLSQIGKYVPGGVWNVLAAGELGASRAIPRRRSVSAMAVAVLVSLVTGVGLGVVTVAAVGARGLDLRWLWWFAPVVAVAMVPAVLNRLLALAMRLARRPPLDQPLTTSGTARAAAWALGGWVVIGAQVFVLGVGLGLPPTSSSFLLCVGAYALAWVVGFVVVLVPAGLGARELVLAAVLGGALGSGEVIVVVLASRVLQTLGDVALAGLGALVARRGAAAAAPAADAEG